MLDPSLLHAVLQVRGLVAKEHVTGAGGGIAGCRMELPFNVAHCMGNTSLTDEETQNTVFGVTTGLILTRFFPLV